MPAASQKKSPKRRLRQARQSRSKATVNAIVEAAARILADDGWRGVNTNAIARRAGVSVGSVYEYFPDKQAILAVIIDRHLAAGEAMLADAAKGLSGRLEIDDIVRALVYGFIRLHQDDPRLHRVLAGEVPISSAQRERIEALRSGIIALVAKVLSEHVDEAELKATILVDTADALTHRWIVDQVGLPASADIMVAQASKMLKGYLS
jgi:AcrR family transcriptional regulator